MRIWGEDNFANEGARDYLELLTAKLVATASEIFIDTERLELDEDGESMFMPSVELLALPFDVVGADAYVLAVGAVSFFAAMGGR